jgi:glycosyltransferase involved in cell wall biosynthesis
MMYSKWLNEVMEIAAKINREIPVAGLCHITLGSFRVLPPYCKLGIPYTLGPIGGGECSPISFLFKRRAPLTHKIMELGRPVINNAFGIVPSLREVMKRSALALATSTESERVLKIMGARKTKVVFPDAFDQCVDEIGINSLRSAQKAQIENEIKLLWQGRPLWWKAPDLALLAVKEALSQGVRLKLTMISNWDSSVGASIRSMADKMGISEAINFSGYMARDKLLEVARDHHAFFATSMHDSGGIPLIEAQSQGLPCLTPALGGNRDALCPETGIVNAATNTFSFVKGAANCIIRWQKNPNDWEAESIKAVRFSKTFTQQRIDSYVADYIYPVLGGNLKANDRK